MFDAKRLLDQFLGSGGGTDLGKALEQMRGGRPGAAAATGSGGGGLGGALGGILGGGAGSGALAGGLAGLLLGSKQGRKLGGSLLKLGGVAVVGALAYTAWRNWQAGRQPAAPGTAPPPMLPPPSDTPFNPADEREQQDLGRTLLRAMIAGAKADGHIDAAEQGRIFAEIDRLALDADDKAFVMDELRRPLDVGQVAGAARSPEQAAEIYAASLLAIDVDNAAERGYLALLAARLGLDDALVQHLHATVAGATAKVPAGGGASSPA